MTAVLEGGEWSASRPDPALPPGKTRYPFYRRLVGTQGRSGRAEKFAPPGFDPLTFQPVVSRYADWVTRPTDLNIYCLKKQCERQGKRMKERKTDRQTERRFVFRTKFHSAYILPPDVVCTNANDEITQNFPVHMQHLRSLRTWFLLLSE